MHGLHMPVRTGRSLRRALVSSVLALAALLAASAAAAQPTPLDPLTIPKYVEAMPMPLRIDATHTSRRYPLELSMNEFQQQLLPASFYATLPAPYNAGAYLWCYKAKGWPQTFPGPTLEARVGTPTSIKYVNNLVGPGGTPPVLQGMIAIDQTIHWADPLGQHGAMTPYVGPVPAVPHLHGGEVPSAFDGGPDAWWTPGLAIKGKGFVTDLYTYPNRQEATTLWYHDHALGATRTNVYAGLAGFYLLRDPYNEPWNLPGGSVDRRTDRYGNPYEREIVIQDRMFDTNGQLYWPVEPTNPDVHPIWGPEFFGDVIMVNGKTWPYLQVEPRRYRFRFLDGSNARFYRLRAVDATTGAPGPVFWQIGSDGGLLEAPVALNDPAAVTPLPMTIAPGERMDIIVDFTGLAGRTFTLVNDATAPFPDGDPADMNTTGQIMQIRVGAPNGRRDYSLNPATTRSLRRPIERPANPTATRALTLNENMGPGGPLEMYVNNTMWDMMPTENMAVGTTEVWEIINLTADTHPIHLHLLQYQILSRQAFDVDAYMAVYGMPMAGMGAPFPYDVPSPATGNKLGGNPDVTPYLLGPVMAPDANETGWKDTFRMNVGEVTRVLVRAAPQAANRLAGRMGVKPGMNLFPFDPTASMTVIKDKFGYPGGPGYVWHCHIVDHEDNEMMRPFFMTALTAPVPMASDVLSGDPEALPARVELSAARPNPALGSTRIAFSLPQADDVELVVYDLAGREVSRLAEGRYAAGEHAITWAGTDRAGKLLPSGTYLYRLRTSDTKSVRKLVLVH